VQVEASIFLPSSGDLTVCKKCVCFYSLYIVTVNQTLLPLNDEREQGFCHYMLFSLVVINKFKQILLSPQLEQRSSYEHCQGVLSGQIFTMVKYSQCFYLGWLKCFW